MRVASNFLQTLLLVLLLTLTSCQRGTVASKASPSPTRPERVITLIPSLAEMVHELDQGDSRIAGVSEFTDFPASLKAKPSVGPYQNVSLERLRSLHPDLVLASTDGNSKDQIERIREWGIPVLIVSTKKLDDIPAALTAVADALGIPARGKKLADEFREEMKKAEAQGKKRRPQPRVLLQLGDEPLIVVGGDSYLDEIVRLVGARNVYSDLTQAYPRISYEDAVKRDPDWIFVLAMHGDQKAFERMRDSWKRFPKLSAVRANRVRILRADSLLRPGVRLPEGWKILAGELGEP